MFAREPRSSISGAALAVVVLFGVGCAPGERAPEVEPEAASAAAAAVLAKYESFALRTDQVLSERQQQLVVALIEAARPMDEIFWKQAYGDPAELLSGLDPVAAEAATLNFGPWDRLDGDRPFLDGVGAKPPGARFYPRDATREEIEAALASADEERAAALRSLYTVVRRNDEGDLVARPYREEYSAELAEAAAKLRTAAELAENGAFARYLRLRAEALESDDYLASDLAWMEMKDNPIDLVIGPIETYEDQLMGFKAAAEAYVLVKDAEWSKRLARYADFLPELQRNLPVPDEYKQERPGSDADLNAYDVVFVAGDANAGSKTIAINLPNDERVQLEKGTRRLQLKNVMRAKFEKILVPIAAELLAGDLQEHVTFDAFFANTMFHEVAHGLGIKETITGNGRVRQALRDQASALEEGKADVLGLFMITQLAERGELSEVDLRDNYTTFLASIFRSIRFGSSSAHGVANLVRFNFFRDRDAFSFDAETGRYQVDFDRMRDAVNALAERILVLQGDGDYEAAREFVTTMSARPEDLEDALERLADLGIPVDIKYEQGREVLGF